MTEQSFSMNRKEIIKLYASSFPDKPAIISEERQLTWSELYERSRILARSLYGLGLRPGDKAALMIYNLPEYWETTVALSILGAGLVPIGYRSKAPEIEYIANNSESQCLLFYHDFADRILPHRQKYETILPEGFVSIGDTSTSMGVSYNSLMENPPEVDLDNLPEVAPQTMIYTSGTTGKPKGAARSNIQKLSKFGSNVIQTFKYSSDEVHLVSCPLYHSAPILFSSMAFFIGGTLVLMPKFKPEDFLENLERYRVTSAFIVPTILDSILKLPVEMTAKRDFSSLRALICGGAPLFPQIKLGILDRMGPVLYEFYGATETGINTIITPEEIREKPGSVGRAFPDNELLILDDDGNELPDGERGELFIYNPFLMDGYYKNEKATRDCYHDKYMSVGDVAVRDEDGFYYIVDRKKDMIIRGGVNIYPAEVEEVMHLMRGISDVAVVGLPDKHWGEIVAAVVVRDEGIDINEESIKDYCIQQLSNHKVPEIISFRDEIKRSPQGKILKREIREDIESELAS